MNTSRFSKMFAAVLVSALATGACVAGDNGIEVDDSGAEQVRQGVTTGTRGGLEIPRYRVVVVKAARRAPTRGLETPGVIRLEPVHTGATCTDAHGSVSCVVGNIVFADGVDAQQIAERYNIREDILAGTEETVAIVEGQFLRNPQDVNEFVVTSVDFPQEDADFDSLLDNKRMSSSNR